MIRKRNNKKALYETIMKDVAKAVKRHLNEDINVLDLNTIKDQLIQLKSIAKRIENKGLDVASYLKINYKTKRKITYHWDIFEDEDLAYDENVYIPDLDINEISNEIYNIFNKKSRTPMIGISFNVDSDDDTREYLDNFFVNEKYKQMCGSIYDEDEFFYYFIPENMNIISLEQNFDILIEFLNDFLKYINKNPF